jgi:hypothetical protein
MRKPSNRAFTVRYESAPATNPPPLARSTDLCYTRIVAVNDLGIIAMNRTNLILILAIMPLASCVSPEAKVQIPAPPFTTGEQAFVADFKKLHDKHGTSSARFVLADVGAENTARSFTQPIFECSYDDQGGLMGCDRVDEQ